MVLDFRAGKQCHENHLHSVFRLTLTAIAFDPRYNLCTTLLVRRLQFDTNPFFSILLRTSAALLMLKQQLELQLGEST
jgi:hypothetical protein